MYSFVCKHCGDNIMSKDKSKVRDFARNHRVDPSSRNLDGSIIIKRPKYCEMKPTKRGTLARPKIAGRLR